MQLKMRRRRWQKQPMDNLDPRLKTSCPAVRIVEPGERNPSTCQTIPRPASPASPRAHGRYNCNFLSRLYDHPLAFRRLVHINVLQPDAHCTAGEHFCFNPRVPLFQSIKELVYRQWSRQRFICLSGVGGRAGKVVDVKARLKGGRGGVGGGGGGGRGSS